MDMQIIVYTRGGNVHNNVSGRFWFDFCFRHLGIVSLGDRNTAVERE